MMGVGVGVVRCFDIVALDGNRNGNSALPPDGQLPTVQGPERATSYQLLLPTCREPRSSPEYWPSAARVLAFPVIQTANNHWGQVRDVWWMGQSFEA